MNRITGLMYLMCGVTLFFNGQIFDVSPIVKAEQQQFSEPPKQMAPPYTESGPTLEDMVQLSTRIVLAKCRSTESAHVASLGDNIFTFTEFDVSEVLKGNIVDKLTLRLLGGRVGDVEDIVKGMPGFTPGEEVVLLLGDENVDGYPTVFEGGVFRISMDVAKEEKVVTTSVNSIPLYNSTNGLSYSETPKTIYLEDLLYSIEKLL